MNFYNRIICVFVVLFLPYFAAAQSKIIFFVYPYRMIKSAPTFDVGVEIKIKEKFALEQSMGLWYNYYIKNFSETNYQPIGFHYNMKPKYFLGIHPKGKNRSRYITPEIDYTFIQKNNIAYTCGDNECNYYKLEYYKARVNKLKLGFCYGFQRNFGQQSRGVFDFNFGLGIHINQANNFENQEIIESSGFFTIFNALDIYENDFVLPHFIMNLSIGITSRKQENN